MYGLVGSTADYQLAYSDPREQIWSELVAPTLRQMAPQVVAARAGMSERGVRDIRGMHELWQAVCPCPLASSILFGQMQNRLHGARKKLVRSIVAP